MPESTATKPLLPTLTLQKFQGEITQAHFGTPINLMHMKIQVFLLQISLNSLLEGAAARTTVGDKINVT